MTHLKTVQIMTHTLHMSVPSHILTDIHTKLAQLTFTK